MQYELSVVAGSKWMPDTRYRSLAAAMRAFSKAVAAGADAASVCSIDQDGYYITTQALFNAKSLKGAQVI